MSGGRIKTFQFKVVWGDKFPEYQEQATPPGSLNGFAIAQINMDESKMTRPVMETSVQADGMHHAPRPLQGGRKSRKGRKGRKTKSHKRSHRKSRK